MYRAIIHPDVLVNNNKKICKTKIPLKTKVFAWYLRKRYNLTKANLVKHIDREVQSVFLFIMVRKSNTYSSNANFIDYMVNHSNSFFHVALLIFLAVWLNGVDHRFEFLLGWGA
jgi:hypothetical protein